MNAETVGEVQSERHFTGESEVRNFGSFGSTRTKGYEVIVQVYGLAPLGVYSNFMQSTVNRITQNAPSNAGLAERLSTFLVRRTMRSRNPHPAPRRGSRLSENRKIVGIAQTHR